MNYSDITELTLRAWNIGEDHLFFIELERARHREEVTLCFDEKGVSLVWSPTCKVVLDEIRGQVVGVLYCDPFRFSAYARDQEAGRKLYDMIYNFLTLPENKPL